MARVAVEFGEMKKFSFIAVVLAIAVATTAATARAAEVTAPVAAQQIAWGQTVSDLQLGLRYDIPNHVYRRGETAQFDLIVRNVGKKAVNFQYFSPLFPSPFGTDEKGNTLANVLKSPPPLGYPMREATLSLAPGAQSQLEQTELRMGAPLTPTRFWALDGAPGIYNVGFSANFVFGPNAKRPPLRLKSGLLALQVTADSPPRAHVDQDTYTWGREVNGLQLGIRLQVPGEVILATKAVPLGTLVTFGLAVRNVSEAPLQANYIRNRWSISPRVVTEAGAPLSLYAQGVLSGAAHDGPFLRVTQTLDAGEATEFGQAWLSVGAPADKEYRDPVLSVEPGRYRVRYSYDFTPDYHRKEAAKDPKTGDMRIPPKDEADVTSSEIILEVAPAQTIKIKLIGIR